MLTKRVLESLDPGGRVRLARLHAARSPARTRIEVSAPILAERKAEAAGQFSLFGGGDDPDAAGQIDESVLQGEEFDKRDLLRYEKEMLGQFVTDHPLLGVKDALRRTDDRTRSGISSSSATATS